VASSAAASQTTGVQVIQKKSVRFENVNIREYSRIIGDNPSCSSGAPVG
jgi:hypothetical protein